MKTMRFILGIVLLLLSPISVFASSTYVLPYPSAMPGSKGYIVHQLWETVNRYWYFGDFAKLSYKRQLADKYLVEAKTLLEYGQYRLALSALKKSDNYYKELLTTINSIDHQRAGRSEKISLLRAQAKKHVEVLQEMKSSTPATYLWQEENAEPLFLDLHGGVERSRELRNILL